MTQLLSGLCLKMGTSYRGQGIRKASFPHLQKSKLLCGLSL